MKRLKIFYTHMNPMMTRLARILVRLDGTGTKDAVFQAVASALVQFLQK